MEDVWIGVGTLRDSRPGLEVEWRESEGTETGQDRFGWRFRGGDGGTGTGVRTEWDVLCWSRQ